MNIPISPSRFTKKLFGSMKVEETKKEEVQKVSD